MIFYNSLKMPSVCYLYGATEIGRALLERALCWILMIDVGHTLVFVRHPWTRGSQKNPSGKRLFVLRALRQVRMSSGEEISFLDFRVVGLLCFVLLGRQPDFRNHLQELGDLAVVRVHLLPDLWQTKLAARFVEEEISFLDFHVVGLLCFGLLERKPDFRTHPNVLQDRSLIQTHRIPEWLPEFPTNRFWREIENGSGCTRREHRLCSPIAKMLTLALTAWHLHRHCEDPVRNLRIVSEESTDVDFVPS